MDGRDGNMRCMDRLLLFTLNYALRYPVKSFDMAVHIALAVQSRSVFLPE
jgi:hypothetical protein